MPWNNLNKMWIEEGEQQIANNTTRDNLVEALNHDEYEEIHKDSLEKLRSVFPEIPEDLTHIYVKILYEWKVPKPKICWSHQPQYLRMWLYL